MHGTGTAVLPFVVEHAGGINKEGMRFLRMCRAAADSKLNARACGLPSWSSKGPSIANFFLQSLSLANLKGLGHLFMVAVPLSSNVALIGGDSTKPNSSY